MATIVASCCGAVIYILLFLTRRNRDRFATVTGAKPSWTILRRLLRYGLPNGIHFMLDVAAFAFFVILMGRLGKAQLTATSLAFRINSLGFMPMIGFGSAVSILVGQALGRNDPKTAQRCTWSATYLAFIYMAVLAAGYWFRPQWFLLPFAARADPADFAAVAPLAQSLLAFVAVFCLADTGNITFSGALRGAGDTRFVMILGVALNWAIMVVPSCLIIHYRWGPGDGLYLAWGFATAYVCVLALVFLLRFLSGKWKSMRVIEAAPAPLPLPPVLPEIPAPELET